MIVINIYLLHPCLGHLTAVSNQQRRVLMGHHMQVQHLSVFVIVTLQVTLDNNHMFSQTFRLAAKQIKHLYTVKTNTHKNRACNSYVISMLVPCLFFFFLRITLLTFSLTWSGYIIIIHISQRKSSAKNWKSKIS